MIMSVFCYCEV